MAKKKSNQVKNAKPEVKTRKQLVLRTSYINDLKKVSAYPEYKKNSHLLDEYFELLMDGKPLPDKAKDHKMVKHSPGELRYCRDFHLSPDIVVIYRNDGDTIEIIHIGKHNKLRIESYSSGVEV